MYSVIVFSPYDGDGKTTLIETVIGKPLEWKNIVLSPTFKYSMATIEYKGVQIEIKELGIIDESNEDIWQQIANMFIQANHLVYVNDSTEKSVLEDLDLFFDTYDIPNKIEEKTWLVFTKCDTTNPIETYWESLSNEDKEQLNASLSKEAQERFKSWKAAAYNDWNLCLGLHMMSWNKAPLFEVDCRTMRGIPEIRQRINTLR